MLFSKLFLFLFDKFLLMSIAWQFMKIMKKYIPYNSREKFGVFCYSSCDGEQSFCSSIEYKTLIHDVNYICNMLNQDRKKVLHWLCSANRNSFMCLDFFVSFSILNGIESIDYFIDNKGRVV